MSEAQTAESAIYTIPVARVRESIDSLLARDIHQFFIAYLFLRRTAARIGRTTALTPDWSELGVLLEVSGGPPGKPFLRPFWRGQRNAGQEWLNSNLAGSYAASSLRGVPMRVVETDASGRFNLRPEHWNLAFEHLLFKKKVPALAVAAFVFRDYGIVSELLPSPEDLIALFRREYGYRPEDDVEFSALYDDAWRGSDGPWAETFESDGQG